MSEEYIRILEESLEKKVSLLKKITVLNEKQRQLFENEDTMPDELSANIEAKGELVDQIMAVDEGFESLFKRVSEELSVNREQHAEAIRRMQDMIRSITELSAKVEGQEQRNRNLASKFYASKKSQTKKIRKGAAAVNRYYQGMMRNGPIRPQFMDTKE